MRKDCRMWDNLVAIPEVRFFPDFAFPDQTNMFKLPDGSGYEVFVYAGKKGEGFYCRIRPAGLIMGIYQDYQIYPDD